MKLSEVINALKEMKFQYGDIEVVTIQHNNKNNLHLISSNIELYYTEDNKWVLYIESNK
jgi:hypothetical protein